MKITGMVLAITLTAFVGAANAQTDLYTHTLFIYDDSWQSKAEWDDCRFPCFPRTTVRWRSLRHNMTLVVKGPDQQYVRSAVHTCMQQAFGAGAVAALAAVYTGGAAMGAAWPAFTSYFGACMANQAAGSVVVGIEDRSHWTDW